MTEPLRTDLLTSTDRGIHPDQHNEINRRFIALEQAVTAVPGGLDDRLDAIEPLMDGPGSFDARLDAIEQALSTAGNARRTTGFPLGTLGAGATTDTTITLAPSYTLLAITCSAPGLRVRVYTSTGARTADSARPVTTPPTPGTGLVLEYVSTDTAEHYLTPVPVGAGTDPGSNDVPISVFNGGSAGPVTVTLLWTPVEQVAVP